MSIVKNVTLIIVNYNSSQYTNNLLFSLEKNYYKQINEIIIVDNNSKDFKKLNTKDKKIKLIKNNKNLGFSKAVNQGIYVSKNNFIKPRYNNN